MQATIITIGDELLLGQIVDTNSRFIARELAKLGAQTVEMRSVADSKPAILGAVKDAWASSDVVLITGGLGPTKDDITKSALAEFFNTPLVKNETVYAWLTEFFAACPQRFNAYNQTQALLPQACVPLRNLKGTACGMWFEQGGQVLVSLPGVPFEMEDLLVREVLPRLKKQFSDLFVAYKLATVFEITEADLAMRLAPFEEQLPASLGLAYLPSVGFVRLRLTAKTAGAPLSAQFDMLCHALHGLPFTVGEEEFDAQYIARRLGALGKTVACAESCTGGNIAHTLTQVPGASAYFLGGVVSYANDVKINVLGVRADDLQKYGAVSEPVALQMAEGVRKLTGAQWAVSTTGIAGPDGATPEKPVGTVWIALAGPNGSTARRFLFSHTRERNIGRATNQALRWLVEEMEK